MSSIAFGMRGKMQPTIPVEEAHLHIGKELFSTDWLTISEDRVKQFRWSTFANGDDAEAHEPDPGAPPPLDPRVPWRPRANSMAPTTRRTGHCRSCRPVYHQMRCQGRTSHLP